MDAEDFCRYSLLRQGPGGQYVTTAEKRFADLDGIAVPLILSQKNPSIHDIGVSNGVTSLELYNAVAAIRDDFEFCLSDKNFDCFYTGRLARRVYDSDGKFFEGYFFGVFCRSDLSGKYFISRILGRALNRPPGNAPRTRIVYLDRRLRALADSGKIKRISFDALNNDIEDRFTFVRCMNLLILQYFSAEELKRAVNLIIRSLKEGGIFQTGRTVDGVNHATFFMKEGGRLSVIRHVNDGSEINETIKDFIDPR